MALTNSNAKQRQHAHNIHSHWQTIYNRSPEEEVEHEELAEVPQLETLGRKQNVALAEVPQDVNPAKRPSAETGGPRAQTARSRRRREGSRGPTGDPRTQTTCRPR